MPDMLLSFCICLSWRANRPAAADEDAILFTRRVRARGVQERRVVKGPKARLGAGCGDGWRGSRV
jgi:hypothetical protein